MKTRVVKVDNGLTFDNGMTLHDWHNQDCCESHYLDFEHINISDFEGLEFDLSGDTFFNRIEDYGIELVPVKGHTIKIPGYGSNNGYYSSNLSLVLTEPDKANRTFNIDDCQNINWD